MMRVPLNFAVLMEAIGEADCTVAGLVHTTTEVILAAQMILGMQEGIETISSMGIWSIPGFEGADGELLIHADCAVVPDPTANELADIAISTRRHYALPSRSRTTRGFVVVFDQGQRTARKGRPRA